MMNSKSKQFLLMVMAAVVLLISLSANVSAKKQMLPPKESLITEYYYQTKKPIKTWISLSNPAAKTNEDRQITIPKGTVVSGQPVEVKNKQIKKIVIKSSSLSYQIKKAAIQPGYYLEHWQDLTGDIKYSKARFKPVKKPQYVVPYSEGNLCLGTVPKDYPDTFASNQLTVTSDGYIELYKYDVNSGPEGFSNKPMGMAKINKTRVNKNVCYLYYSNQCTGLNDQRVRKSGKYQYRLKVADEDNIKTQTIWDGGKQAFVARLYYAHYAIGNVTYYTEVGEISLDG
ncbi:hypothetical protein [Lentilactobacillus kisonensis]|uniref:Uncharacterized protein n=1 Tax=Lentilactobacillus kisonensis F0435 TaxID=797516 RepID=H1LL60_9LACO|nr:hypothetical protein [Lentilactobacillus kisonensis]EHO45194.1 hypothetical protein HMPREF9104_03368 [Lentilactobacillus kisonensis F0435]